MSRENRAFTLPELLVVSAILIVMAGILAPVVLASRAAGLKTVCILHFRDAALATQLYTTDYDDRFMPPNYQLGMSETSKTDKTWVQLLLPYIGSFDIFRCPADPGARPRLDTSFDQDLVPGDTYSEYYTASLRSNIGYNYVYLAPVVKLSNSWVAESKTTTQVASNSLLFADSVWAVDANGHPTGGGRWLVNPPCRYEVDESGRKTDTFRDGSSGGAIFTYDGGWQPGDADSPMRYGGAWPFHMERINIARLDGGVNSVSPAQYSVGCDVEPNWDGFITDSGAYIWNPQ